MGQDLDRIGAGSVQVWGTLGTGLGQGTALHPWPAAIRAGQADNGPTALRFPPSRGEGNGRKWPQTAPNGTELLWGPAVIVGAAMTQVVGHCVVVGSLSALLL